MISWMMWKEMRSALRLFSSHQKKSCGNKPALDAIYNEPMDSEHAFAAVALPHLDAAYNLARWLTGNRADAEDVVQEAMVRALTYFPSFRGGSSRAWILQIVRNTAYGALKARRGERMTTLADLGEGVAVEDIPDAADGPEKTLLMSSDLAQIDALIEALPAELRETLVLRELEDLSYREIAHVTSVPIGTVMSRLWRARRLLAQAAAEGEKR
jgi:RNA polymerase sigma factor (sigma-70 family)